MNGRFKGSPAHVKIKECWAASLWAQYRSGFPIKNEYRITREEARFGSRVFDARKIDKIEKKKLHEPTRNLPAINILNPTTHISLIDSSRNPKKHA
jgi:hypothetical protein